MAYININEEHDVGVISIVPYLYTTSHIVGQYLYYSVTNSILYGVSARFI